VELIGGGVRSARWSESRSYAFVDQRVVEKWPPPAASQPGSLGAEPVRSSAPPGAAGAMLMHYARDSRPWLPAQLGGSNHGSDVLANSPHRSPFPREEYEARQQRVLAAIEKAGLDAIAVTARWSRGVPQWLRRLRRILCALPADPRARASADLRRPQVRRGRRAGAELHRGREAGTGQYNPNVCR
jgi:hypothetical protein